MPKRDEAVFAAHTEVRISRRRKVEQRTGLSRSSIYAAIKAGTFPKQIHLGPQTVGWLESEIDSWLHERVAASRKASA